MHAVLIRQATQQPQAQFLLLQSGARVLRLQLLQSRVIRSAVGTQTLPAHNRIQTITKTIL